MGEVWVGVDVSKDGLDVAVRPGDEAWLVKNKQHGIKALAAKLKKLTPQRIDQHVSFTEMIEQALQLGTVPAPR